MERLLSQIGTTFYHITSPNSWESIKKNGLNSKQGKIFVSNTGDFPILLAIATEQLLTLDYKENGIVLLKLPQAKNNFIPSEIIRVIRHRLNGHRNFKTLY
jgi:hypothetical protein